MKILLLSEPGSIHTVRWANSLAEKGIDILVFGFGDYQAKDYKKPVQVFSEGKNNQHGLFHKASYVFSIFKVRKIIQIFKPDIVHAHYATSYGLLGRMTGFRPFLLSVWGSDIFDFPNYSYFHKRLLQYNLNGATKILSTSHAMAKETLKFLPTGHLPIETIPFGIDLKLFQQEMKGQRKEIVIGTVKTLTFNYGIDVLIEAFHLLLAKYPTLDLRLHLGGVGRDMEYFINLVKKYQIQSKVVFLGKIEHSDVPRVLNNFDIFAALSNKESFGVSVVEASACSLPVVVTNVGGLPEVVDNDITGIVVNKKDAQQAADAMGELVNNPEKRKSMGKAGRRKVEKYYNWESNVNTMIKTYKSVSK